MGKLATNIAIILGLITLAFGGYYLYQNYLATSNDSAEMETLIENMVNETRVYQLRSKSLNETSLDISFFEDELFRSLRSYRTVIMPKPIGRDNPFSEASDDVTIDSI